MQHYKEKDGHRVWTAPITKLEARISMTPVQWHFACQLAEQCLEGGNSGTLDDAIAVATLKASQGSPDVRKALSYINRVQKKHGGDRLTTLYGDDERLVYNGLMVESPPPPWATPLTAQQQLRILEESRGVFEELYGEEKLNRILAALSR